MFYIIVAAVYSALILASIYFYNKIGLICALIMPDLDYIYLVITAVLIALPALIKPLGIVSLIYLHLSLFGLICDFIYTIFELSRFQALEVLHISFLIPIAATAAVFAYGYSNMRNVRQSCYEFEIPELKKQDGYKIIFASDLHYPNVKENLDYFYSVLSESTEKIDLLILGGDICDEQTSPEEAEFVMRKLGEIETTFGVFFVPGNHDYQSYMRKPAYSEEKLNEYCEKAGIKVLNDRAILLNSEILLIGRRDKSDKRRIALDKLLENSQKELIGLEDAGANVYKILVDHRPLEHEKAAAAGINLQLAGHTHDGQIFPGSQISELFNINEKQYGLKEIGDYKFIVSSGIAGWEYAVRTSGVSEYLLINIKPAK